jgi:hypothetical protein
MVGLNNFDGSPQWQTAIFLAAGAFILVNALRGWAIGVMRQITGIIAFCVACYCVVTFNGRTEEFLGPHLPAALLTGVSVILIWIVGFNVVTLIGRLLFKRTRDYDSGLFQLIYGFGGAVIGAGYGLLVVSVLCRAVRIMGRVAGDQVEVQAAKNQSPPTIALNLAKLKNSLELGPAGRVLSALDPIPDRWYQQLDQYARLSLDSGSIQGLADSPAIRRISQNPRILDLERDPSIREAAQRGDLLGIFTNPKVTALLTDPQIRGVLLSQPATETALSPAQTERETASERQ